MRDRSLLRALDANREARLRLRGLYRLLKEAVASCEACSPTRIQASTRCLRCETFLEALADGGEEADDA